MTPQREADLSPEIEGKARRLYEHMKLYARFPEAGFIGYNDNELLVYVRAKKRQWQGPTFDTWEGAPIKWKFGVGETVAL